MARALVIFHGGCFDGFASAWVAKTALVSIEAIPVFYGQAPPDVTGREVYILDFSYPYETMAQMASLSTSLVVLDHHVTARQALGDLEALFITHNMAGQAVFGEDQSGGRMAWAYFAKLGGWQGMPSPWLVDYTEDRDLWRHALPNSQEVNAALRSYPMIFELWDRQFAGLGPPPVSLVQEGAAIRRRERQIIEEHLRHARREPFDTWTIPIVNATVLFSEIAGELAKGEPFAMVYFDRQDGKRQWSLRSDPQGLDVSEIAKAHGGGGHRHAAGFEETLSDHKTHRMVADRHQLRAALVNLVGVDTREELEQMELVMRMMDGPAKDKAATIDAVHALLATLEETR